MLHIIGEPVEVIRADFLASEAGLEASRDADKAELQAHFGFSGGEDYHHAAPENIDAALTFLCQQYGSLDGYLDTIGFDETWRQKLRDTLG